MVRLKLVTLVQACSSCAIVETLVRESVEKVLAKAPNVEYEATFVGTPQEIEAVPNLEVERFPALLVNGEQITAGSIITPRDLEEIVADAVADAVADDRGAANPAAEAGAPAAADRVSKDREAGDAS